MERLSSAVQALEVDNEAVWSCREGLVALSDEAVGAILSHATPPEVAVCATICSQWARVVRSDGLLWACMFRQRFGGHIEPSEAQRACKRCASACAAINLRPSRGQGAQLTRRAGAAAGCLGRYVIISGGATRDFQMTGDVDVWDPTSHSALMTGYVPSGARLPRRWQHTAVSWQGELWLYGGADSDRRLPCGSLHCLYRADGPATARRPRIACRAVAMEREDEHPSGTDPLRRPHRPGEGPALSGHCARVLDSGDMLCFGGEGVDDEVTNLLWRIALPPPSLVHNATPTVVTWGLVQATGAAPSPRFCHSAEVLASGWLIFGGWAKAPRQMGQLLNREGARPFLNDLHLLDVQTTSWSAIEAIGAVPRARCQSVMFASRDEELVFVFGGACHRAPEPGQAYGDMVMDLDDVSLLHWPSLTWLPSSRLPAYYPQRGGTNALVRTASQTFILGGMNSSEGDEVPDFLNQMTEVVGLDTLP